MARYYRKKRAKNRQKRRAHQGVNRTRSSKRKKRRAHLAIKRL